VSKIENFRVPVIGWNMSLNRYIKLRRGDRKSVVQMMQRCRETLAEGSSLMFFPEGTRSQDGRLRAFKPGAFELAQTARVPIVPIILTGSGDALPKRGFVLRGKSEIRLRVLEPIPWSDFRDEPLDELTARMRALFARELGESPAPRRAARG
jgi:1-acyl-sn-glycerol-3-phosphate acyltransferase